MKSIDHSFYTSKEWLAVREAKLLQAGGLCERCLKKVPPEYNAAEHVHHKVYLNARNVNDPKIAYGLDNLEALCGTCHRQEHFKSKAPKRYDIDENGKVFTRGEEKNNF